MLYNTQPVDPNKAPTTKTATATEPQPTGLNYAGGSPNFNESTGQYTNGYVPPRAQEQPSIPAPTQPQPGTQRSYDPNQAMAQLQQAWGSTPMTQQQQQQLIQAVGYTGGNVTQAQMDQALQLVNQYRPQQQSPNQPTPGQPAPAPAPGGGTGDYSAASFGSWAQTTFGRQPTQAEWNQIGQHVGPPAGPNGTYTAEQYKKGQDFAKELAKQQGWKDPSAPAPTTPAPTGTAPQQGVPGAPGQIGPTPAIEQLTQQAPVAGVPPTFANHNPYQQQQQQLMQSILANPHTMGPLQQQQLRERQKETANSMYSQAQNQAGQRSVASGFGAGGANQQNMQGQMQQDMISQLLAGQRDVAVAANQQNRQDALQALGASSDLSQQGWANDMARAGMNLGQLNQNRAQSLQEYLGMHGANFDNAQLAQNASQFNRNYGLDFLRYLQNDRQFNRQMDQNQGQFVDSMGLNWAQHQGQQMQSFLGFLSGMGL